MSKYEEKFGGRRWKQQPQAPGGGSTGMAQEQPGSAAAGAANDMDCGGSTYEGQIVDAAGVPQTAFAKIREELVVTTKPEDNTQLAEVRTREAPFFLCISSIAAFAFFFRFERRADCTGRRTPARLRFHWVLATTRALRVQWTSVLSWILAVSRLPWTECSVTDVGERGTHAWCLARCVV